MKRSNHHGKALFCSVLSLILCFSMLLGTTFAWFTDEVVSGENKISAGNLDVDVLYEDDNGGQTSIQDVQTLFNDVTLWEPGAVAYENLTVVNLGTLALKYEMALSFTDTNDLEGNVLSDALQVAVVEGGIDNTKTREQIIAEITGWEPLDAWFEQGTLYPEGTDGQVSSEVYGIVIYWQPGINDNAWNVQNGKETSDGQPLNINLGIELTAWQKDYEEDSFGPDYDEGQGEAHKTFRVSNAKELQDALKVDGAYIILSEDITVDSTTEFQETSGNGSHLYLYHVNVTVDLNGHDIIAEADAVKDGKTAATGLFLVRYSTLNIIDSDAANEGRIVTRNKAIPVYGWAHSEINIYGGNFVSNAVDRKESAVYVNNPNVTIHVYGGTYDDAGFAFNTHNTKCADTPVIILHDGIQFAEYANHFADDYAGGRIVLADGCYLKTSLVDGKTVYQIAKKAENAVYTSDYQEIKSLRGDNADVKIVLMDNLNAENLIFLGNGSTTVLDLNGQTVTAENPSQYLFGTQNGGTLTVNGDGKVNAGKGFMANKGGAEIIINGGEYSFSQTQTLNSMDAHCLAQNNSKIVINGGKFTSAIENAAFFFATSNATVEVNGGFFENTADDTPDFFNMGTNKNNTNRIIFKGGTFVNWNPLEDRMCYTGQWPDSYEQFSGPWMLVWDGYKVVSETQANGDIWYSVVPVDGN